MCGIFGIYGDADLQELDVMDHILRHRGPDDHGCVILDHATTSGSESGAPPVRVGLGHRRLAIIDLSSSGHQPMATVDQRYWISYNGEIYNYRELRTELVSEGYRFAGESDTEVVLMSYAAWGIKCLRRFIGMFAMAIFDRETGELVLARDPFGIKPLFLREDDRGLVFASEIKAIRAIRSLSINDEAVYHHLAGGRLPDPTSTFYADVRSLAAGHILRVNPQGGQLIRWYNRPATPHLLGDYRADYSEAVRTFGELFQRSVGRHLIADVPVGFCLSGGIDSSSIVSSAVKRSGARGAYSFSAVFPGTQVDESSWVDTVAADMDVRALRSTPTREDAILTLESLCRVHDEPLADWSVFLQWTVMRLVAESGIKVVLDGQGADELLAGYETGLHHFLRQVRKEWGEDVYLRVVAEFRRNTSFRFLLECDPAKEPPGRQKADEFPIMRPDFYAFHTGKGGRSEDDLPGVNAILADQFFRSSLPKLLQWEDHNSMVHSVEARVPFVTPDLVEHILGQPGDFKFRDGWTKWPMRQSLRGVLHERIRLRKDKLGFAAPNEDWLSIHRNRLLRIVTDRAELGTPFLDLDSIRRNAPALKKPSALHKLFRAATLLLFLEI